MNATVTVRALRGRSRLLGGQYEAALEVRCLPYLATTDCLTV